MASHGIGLDIGTFGVRAAEVVINNAGVRVVRFGQLTLPPGAVVAGEVVDIDAVALTIRRLWERVGFRGRQVVLGVANQRVLVRQTDMPAMTDPDLAAALQFQDTDVLPISSEDARVDFQRLEEFIDSAGDQRVRLLLAAAERSMLSTHLQAVELAGLRVVRVDPMPLALVRSIGRSGLEVLEDGAQCEALVCVGAGVTTIVVHEGGLPRFARFLSEGAGAATEAVAIELGVDLDAAEDMKRRAGSGPADDPAAVAVSRVVVRVVDDIDSSIRFYSSQSPDMPVGRIVLTGAGSRLAGLASRLADTTGLPVEPAEPTRLFSIDAGLSEDELQRAEPNLATVIGLALATSSVAGQRRINLLPVSMEEVREERTRILVAAAAIGALALLLVVIWALRAGQVHSEQQQSAAAANQVKALQSQVAALGNSGNTQGQTNRYQQQIVNALNGDVDWPAVLTQVANVMPNDVWLTAMSGTTSSSPGSLGTVTFSAQGFDQTSTARWLSDLMQLDSLSQPWVGSSSRAGGSRLVTFNSTASLARGALSDRVGQFTGQNP